MRIASGTTDQYIYFVAVDATDLKTRETGLSSFTVYRSRNGGAATAYTTPTVNETSLANMPGVYELLLDEDMTIDSGDVEQEVCLHITHAGMAPVTRVFTLFRPDVTAGETLTVSSGSGNAAVQSIANNAVTAASLAADAGTEIATAVWASGTRTLSALDEDNTTLDLDSTIRSAIGLSAANLDTQLSTIDSNVDDILVDTGTDIPSALTTIDSNVDAILVDTGTDIPGSLSTIDGNVDSILADTNELQTDWTNGGRLDLLIDAVKAKTDLIPGTQDGLTFAQVVMLTASVLLGKASGLDTTTAVFRSPDDNADRVTATVDTDGNRTAVTLNTT